jgi:hypothetical protein
MKTLFRLTIVFTVLLFACNVWAQNRPICPVDDVSGWIALPDPPGSCFVDTTEGIYGIGSIFLIADGTQLLVVFSGNDGNNDFFRYNPKTEGFMHNHDKEGVTAFLCTNWPSSCGLLPNGGFDASWFIGPVTLTVNASMDNAVSVDCPYSIRVQGELIDSNGQGNQVKLHALDTWVPDSKSGCRESMVKIKVDPIE